MLRGVNMKKETAIGLTRTTDLLLFALIEHNLMDTSRATPPDQYFFVFGIIIIFHKNNLVRLNSDISPDFRRNKAKNR